MTFVKGKSGNPSGRPKMLTELAELCRGYTPKIIETLYEISQNGDKDTARAKACDILLDRGWGKAPQELLLGEAESGPPTIRVIFETETKKDEKDSNN